MKAHRRLFFLIGKFLKYTIWVNLVLFGYHYYRLRYSKDIRKEPHIAFYTALAYEVDAQIRDIYSVLTRPPVTKLLPDKPPLMPGQVFPKTLVLNLRGTLVHSEYKFGTGFEVVKRPGLSIFLQRMSRQYEIVIFGDEESSLVQDICEALDPEYRMITGRLGHECTLLKDGHYVKDISYLNRDIKDIIVIENQADKVKFHPHNVIELPLWTGDRSDRELYDIIPFLEHVASPGLDVRKEVQLFGVNGTSKKYNEVQLARRDAILQQRKKGMGALFARDRKDE